ncbi:3-oxoacyl-[acyl-carrier-protein] reductase FabG [Ciona intestinalis]
MDKSDFVAANQPPLDQAFTKRRFDGKVALVAGGASGIGLASAERFASDGASVAILDINQTAGKHAEAYLKGLGYKVKFYSVDVENRDECFKIAEQVTKDNDSKIDAVVNNAVYFGSKALDAREEDYEKSFSVNVIGTSNIVQACVPFMSPGSAIVNMSSITAARAQPCRWTYAATKGAIKTMTKHMALDLAKNGIRVNSVGPGWTWSPEMAKASPDGTMEAMRSSVDKFQIVNRFGKTSEVASVIVFLCSRDAAFVTGTSYKVDGGYCAMGPERTGSNDLFAAMKTN